MDKLVTKIRNLSWPDITVDLNEKGYSLVPNVLDTDECVRLKATYDDHSLFRKTVDMERYRFGSGEYKYYHYPLPELIATLRTQLYPMLAPIASNWASLLNTGHRYPLLLDDFLHKCHTQGQTLATPLILKYEQGGFNTLHQDLYGSVYFPIQAVFMLDNPGTDFTGGEFVLMQQNPRAQSRAIVVNPEKGDMLLFATNSKPSKSRNGFSRVNLKHGVSEVLSGTRHTLGIIFHDALS